MSRTDSLSGIHNDRIRADCGTVGPLHIDADCPDTRPHLQDTHERWKDGKLSKVTATFGCCRFMTACDLLLLPSP